MPLSHYTAQQDSIKITNLTQITKGSLSKGVEAGAPLVPHLPGVVEVFSHTHIITHTASTPATAFHGPENKCSKMELWPEPPAAHTSSFLSAGQLCPGWMQMELQL